MMMEINRYLPGPDGTILKTEVQVGFPHYARRHGGSGAIFFSPVYDVLKETELGQCSDKAVRDTFKNPVVPDSTPSDLEKVVPSYQRGSDGKFLPISAVFNKRSIAADW